MNNRDRQSQIVDDTLFPRLTATIPNAFPQFDSVQAAQHHHQQQSQSRDAAADADADADADAGAAPVVRAVEALSWLRSLPPRDWDYEWQLSVGALWWVWGTAITLAKTQISAALFQTSSEREVVNFRLSI